MFSPRSSSFKSWRRSLPKGFLNFEIHPIVSGVLGVAIGVAGLLLSLRDGKILYRQVPWASSQKALSNVEFTVAGLQNLGNNCFLNVVLQALASCGSFHSFIRSTLEVDDEEMEERADKFPLSVALVLLLEELCTVREEKTVLSPRKLMLAMSSYVSNFTLTRQQDASEALLLLLSSLEEELLCHYTPPSGSLMDVSAFSCKICHPKLYGEEKSVCQQWRQGLFGQFDGIIGSLLTCGSCSSQLSLDFEFFRCLNIAPVLQWNGAVRNGGTLEDCLKYFTMTETLENYCCHRCSHMKALKYLSLRPVENKEKIDLISQCVRFDSCDCRILFTRDGLPWPKGSSHASKRLVIARYPKILCIHVQRAAMDSSGDIIKLEGQVEFPLFLDLFPFSAAAKNLQLGKFSEEMKQSTALRESIRQHERDTSEIPSSQTFGRVPSSNSTFRLTSVVEHYGGPGSGHYAIYRKLKPEVGPVRNTQQGPPDQWLYISDHRVSLVSEADVLAAEASLLFYEKVNTLTSVRTAHPSQSIHLGHLNDT